MATAQDTPGTPGHEDTGRGLGNDESFAGALATGTDAPEDPWARVVEQLAWEERRGASLAANLSAPLATAPSDTAPRPPALPRPAAAPAADLPTKPALPEAPAQYGQWRAQALARGLRSVFITAADDFTSAPPSSPGPWLLAAPSPPALPAVTAELRSRPDPAPAPPAMTPGLQSPPPVRHPGGLLGAVQRPDLQRQAERPPAQEPAPVTPSPPQSGLLSQVRRPGGLLGAVQRPVSSRPPEKPPAQEPAPATASSPPLSEARLRALAARADQAVRQSVQQGKTLLRRLLRRPESTPPHPTGSD